MIPLPPTEIGGDYINRHSYHSINVQAICLPVGTFGDVLVRFPVSVHDSRICKTSGAGMYVENTFPMGEHLFRDSGYHPQSNYNYVPKKTRVIMEQTIVWWKQRFHCL